MDGVPNLRTPFMHFSRQLYTQLAATLVPFPIANFANGVLGYNIVDCNNIIVIAFILAVYKYYYEA